MYVPTIYFVYVLSFAAVVNGQVVTVTLQSEASYVGVHTTLSCSFPILNSSYVLFNLDWFKGENSSDSSTWRKIAEFYREETSPIYSNGYGDESRYLASKDNAKSISTFEILNVEFSRDRGQYLCRVSVIQSDGMNLHEVVVSTDLIVYILPTSIDLSDSTGNYSSTGGTSYLVEGKGRLYTCQVPGIHPEATFSWTVGSQPLTPDSNENDVDADGLITSRSMATLTANGSNHGEMLKCQATNKDDNPGISISVTLDVKVPPKTSVMSLLDSSGPLQDPADVIEKREHTFTCRVQGTRPAATIKWFLNDVEQTTNTPSPGGGNGLVDTEGHWTFTAQRVNHRQIVRCEANTEESEPPFPSVNTTLNVIVFPSIITLSDSTGASYPATGGTSYLVEGDNPQYTCEVPDINPGASFTWTVGDRELDHSDTNVTYGPDGFTNSTSDASLIASFEHHGQDLKCLAINKGGADGKSVSVIIDVKVPPKESSVSLSYSEKELDPGVNLTVNQGEQQTLTCTVRGSRPAATIDLYRNGSLEQTEDKIPAGNGLVNTTEILVFTPLRNYHKQLVECVAKTNESTRPYPAANLTLDVDGPPDTPVISGSVTMTENVATTLTCTADMGYPNDWDLVWSNEDTAIENPSDTTAVLSETSQRYMFTSQLEFTPKRQDNTHFINCSASRTSWTSTPIPEQTTGPINVQYETNITNKHQTEVGVSSGSTANLCCTAKGNPAPVITWFHLSKTEIIHGGNDNKYMVEVSYTTSDTDMTSGKVTTSKLTIQKVDGQIDYGVYTCNSTNGIGIPDSHKINLNGTRRPNKPTGVVRTGQTSSSIAVNWTAGYDGGEPQWFHVGYKKTADSSETVSDNKIDGGATTYMYNVDGLESYTVYEIRVYAENELGRNPSPGSIVEYTLPVSVAKAGITIKFNVDEGTLTVSGLKDGGGCIQLEVKYEGNSSDWKQCGKCIYKADKVVLSSWCSKTKKRRRRATDVVNKVRASYCQGILDSEICGAPTDVKPVFLLPAETPGSSSGGIIAGGLVGGIFLVVIIIILIWYLRKTSPSDPKSSHTDTSSIELATDNFGRNGQVNEGLQGSVDDEPETPTTTWSVDQATKTGGAERSAKPAAVERMVTDTGDTYALVNKEKPKDKSPPPNLPDVTYADVNKKAQAKRPKKYVPPSKADQESEYEDVRLPPQNMKSKIGAGASGYEVVNLDSPKTSTADEENDYADVSQHQSPSGRTVNEDGLIYMEVGHYKKHPVNQPPIQTEESTTYASIDFKRLVAPDVAK